MKKFCWPFLFCTMLTALPVRAEETRLWEPVADISLKAGNQRNLGTLSLIAPMAQDEKTLVFADLRTVLSDQQTWEGNVGVGLRKITGPDVIIGSYLFFDSRVSESNNTFQQITTGAEVIGKNWDGRINLYTPVGRDKKISGQTAPSAFLSGTKLFRQDGQTYETSMKGYDVEFGHALPLIDNTRVYLASYKFTGDGVPNVHGFRTRLASDIGPWLRLGVEYQFADRERGNAAFGEIRVRWPFDGWMEGNKRQKAMSPLQRHMMEPVVRDIDIVTGEKDTTTTATALAPDGSGPIDFFFVDNTAAAGGDGSRKHPFNTLANAEAAAGPYDTIYVLYGDGTSAGMNAGVTIDDPGQRLIGSGASLTIDSSRIRSSSEALNTKKLNGYVLAASAENPILTNTGGDGIRIAADDVVVAGLTVNGTAGDGIAVAADGAGDSFLNARIEDVTSTGNDRHGLYVYGANDGSVSISVGGSSFSANTGFGVAVYDDTSGAFDVDLGGGNLGSSGGNTLSGNALADLAVEYDGGNLSAMNNWWGQAGGPVSSQIYLGAPLIDGLYGYWRLDETSGAASSDSSGAGNNGTLQNFADADAAWTDGTIDGALEFAGDDDFIQIADFDESDTGTALTVSYWFNADTLSPTDTQISKWDLANTANANSWGIRGTNAAGTELLAFVSQAADAGNNYFTTTDASLTPGTWTNITMVYDGTGAGNADRLKLYRNGVQLNGNFTGAIPATLHDTATPVTIGRELINTPGFADFFDGKIDDVRIYNRPFTQDQVDELYRMNTVSTVITAGALSAAP